MESGKLEIESEEHGNERGKLRSEDVDHRKESGKPGSGRRQ
ncbi:MAG TPA: hypothetical protein VLQ45_16295 [Thermoanaerobaculia bacterium]|nr:hypothetical protein [Thermoanaerobaculia bacterium]